MGPEWVFVAPPSVQIELYPGESGHKWKVVQLRSVPQFDVQQSPILPLKPRLRSRHRIGGPVAGRAVLGCRFVKKDRFGLHHLRQLVALAAAYVLVCAAQRKCSLLVVEKRGFPLHAIVAFRAARDLSLGELFSVNVFVAILALGRRHLEIHVHQLGFKVRRLVAIDASRRTMGAKQWKLGLGVVEARQFLPRLRSVASLASRNRTVGPSLLHSFFELPFVGIIVATGATQVLPVVNDCRLGLELRRLLVTFGTRDRNMPAGEREMRLLVLGQGERGWLVSLERMAAIASVEVRCRGKLPRMLIGMAIGAVREFNLEQCVFPLRDVTLSTFQASMSALQRIGAGGVFLHREGRRFPSLHGVAGGAFYAARTLGELAVMRIGLVTIHALLEYQRFFKVSVGVALGAIHGLVLAFEGKLGLGVVEALIDSGERNLLPSVCRVARLAALREASVMRVLMAVGA